MTKENGQEQQIESVRSQNSPQENSGEREVRVEQPSTSSNPPLTSEKSGDDEKNSRDEERNRLAFWALIVSFFALLVSAGSWYNSKRSANAAENSAAAAKRSAAAAEDNVATAKAAFKADQRAAVYLGLPDGKFAEFAPTEEGLKIVLYFRNYGSSVSRNTVIKIWSVSVTLENPFVTVNIPPSIVRRREIGPDVPPGFPHTEVLTAPSGNRKLYETGQVMLKLIGRITYRDSFGSYCDTFSASYEPIIQSFRLMAGHALCDDRPHEILFCRTKEATYDVEPSDGVKAECTKDGFVLTKIK